MVVRNLLEQSLAPFADGVEVNFSREETDSRDSERFGLRTRYLRTVHYACLKEGFEQPNLPCLVGGSATSREAVHGSHSLDDTARDLHGTTVFSLGHGPKIKLFAWLPVDMFEYLTNAGTTGSATVQQWLSKFQLQQDPVKAQKVAFEDGCEDFHRLSV